MAARAPRPRPGGRFTGPDPVAPALVPGAGDVPGLRDLLPEEAEAMRASQEAVLAERHGIPFYAAAPRSTFDLSRTHDQVTIEERAAEEVVQVRGRRIAPKGVPVANPAFDVTPPGLVTSMITERGLVKAPFEDNIPQLMS